MPQNPVASVFPQRRRSLTTSVSSEPVRSPTLISSEVFGQHDDLGEAEPKNVPGTLRTAENVFEESSDRDRDSVGILDMQQTPVCRSVTLSIPADLRRNAEQRFQQPRREQYSELPPTIENENRDLHADESTVIDSGKRRRQSEDELSDLGQDRKRSRSSRGEGQTYESNPEELDADLTMLMRRYLVSLDEALRRLWVCLCQNCSGLKVRLSPPQHNMDLHAAASFDVFFGVRSARETVLQEAKITVKDPPDSRLRRSSETNIGNPPEFANICQSITESLAHRCCLHFALENGVFQRLHPQPKAFGSDRMSRPVSLSALFNKQINALLPFLETPWVQPPFDHSMIQFFEPQQDGKLPDITKPFLALEHLPVIPARNTDNSDASKYRCYPLPSVVALGILLYEINYCTPAELMAENLQAARSVNDDFYTCGSMLHRLNADTGGNYYLATKACLFGDFYKAEQKPDFDDVSIHRSFYQNVIKRLEAEVSVNWDIRIEDLGSFDSQKNEMCWGDFGPEVVRLHSRKVDSSNTNNTARALSRSQAHGHLVEPSEKSLSFFDASHQTGSKQENPLSQRWMDNLVSSIGSYADLDVEPAEPVRIAILDSGLDPENPFLKEDQQRANPQIKEARSFVHGTGSHDIRDEIGHGTHALGLLLKVAPGAEIYVARIARQETLDPTNYDDIAEAIHHAVENWKVDIISMSFGVRVYHELMSTAISNALSKRTLLFAAASNDGANLGRAFPAKHSGVFCIHSTDGNGNPSNFNPTASKTDINFSLLGEHVSSYWPAGMNGHNQTVKARSGTSVATSIAAGLAASILSFVRQQDQHIAVESERLGPWLKWENSMDAVFKSMVTGTRRSGYDYITPQLLFDSGSTREEVYGRIKEIKRNMYKY